MKKLLSVLFAVAMVFIGTNLLADSAKITDPTTGHSYQLFDTSHMTWNGAKQECENLNGYLATLTSQVENDFVYSNIGVAGEEIWLGGTEPGEEGSWQWVTGETWSYTNWASGQPDDYLGDQDCLGFGHWLDPAGEWDDLNCAVQHPYICEWEPVIRTGFSLDRFFNLKNSNESFGSWFRVSVDPPDGVVEVAVTTPVPERIVLNYDPDAEPDLGGVIYNWSYSESLSTMGELEARYPDGSYTFEVVYPTLTNTLPPKELCGDFPAYPVITYPTFGQQEVELTPLFTWDSFEPVQGVNPVRVCIDIWESNSLLMWTCLDEEATSFQSPALKPSTPHAINVLFGSQTCDGDKGSEVDGHEFVTGSCAATASTIGTNPVYGTSDLGKHLAYFMLPLGAVIAIRIWRRKR